jgi:hypothetical protein
MLEFNYEMLARDVVGELATRGSLKGLSRQWLEVPREWLFTDLLLA